MLRSKSILAAAFATLLCLSGQSSSAEANTVQTITGTFNDGGTLTGTLTFNQYGYLTAPWNLTTTAGSSITTDVTYGPGDVTGIVGYYAPPTYSTLVTIPGSFEVWDVTYGDQTLSLIFSTPDMGQPDSLVGGYECIASYACSEPTGYDRYLTSDSVTTTPLASTWTMMLLGLAGLGFVACRRNKQGLSFAAA